MTTLLLLPGMDGTGTLFDPLVGALAGSVPLKVVAYPPAEALDYAGLQRIAEAALPADDAVILLGESFSGPIAVSLAAKHPTRVRGLILCCTFVQSPRPLLSPFRRLAALAPLKRIPAPLLSLALLGRHTTPALRAALNAALDRVSAAALRERIQAVLSIDVSADLARLRIPVLHMSASEDRLVPRHASAIVKRFQPSASFVELLGPHGLLQAAPEEAGRVIREFVGAVGEG